MTSIQPTVVSLDFDGTATTDPELYKRMVAAYRERGHKVYIVTMRYPSETTVKEANGRSVQQEWGPLVDGIIATCRKAKKPFVAAMGIKIDIWIDDNPNAVYMDANQIFGAISPEGLVTIEFPGGYRHELHGVPLTDDDESIRRLYTFMQLHMLDGKALLDSLRDEKVKAAFKRFLY